LSCANRLVNCKHRKLNVISQRPKPSEHVNIQMASWIDCVNLIKRALEEPVREIANNAGFEGSVVAQHVMEGERSFGFNAETETYENLMNSGIVDPTKVTRFTLQNAASLAGLLMTTEAMVAEKPKRKKLSAPAMPPEDMY